MKRSKLEQIRVGLRALSSRSFLSAQTERGRLSKYLTPVARTPLEKNTQKNVFVLAGVDFAQQSFIPSRQMYERVGAIVCVRSTLLKFQTGNTNLAERETKTAAVRARSAVA